MHCLLQVFQLEMTTRYVGLEMNNWMNWGQDTSFKNNERLALWAMRIYIPWTLQSGRALFEMMCASVIGTSNDVDDVDDVEDVDDELLLWM